LAEAGEVPIRDLPAAQLRLEAVVDRVARRWEDDLAPAIDRVWKDCIAGVKIDLREWLRRMSEEPGWAPWRFELSFGLPEMSQRARKAVPGYARASWPALLLHVRARLHLGSRGPRRRGARKRAATGEDHRRCHRAGLPSGGSSGRARVRPLRLSRGMRTVGMGPDPAQAG